MTQTCNCGAVTIDVDPEDALQLLTAVHTQVRTHYFGRAGTPTPCSEPRTFTPGKP